MVIEFSEGKEGLWWSVVEQVEVEGGVIGVKG